MSKLKKVGYETVDCAVVETMVFGVTEEKVCRG